MKRQFSETEKPGYAFVIGTNFAASILTQTIFGIGLYFLYKQLLETRVALPDESIRELRLTTLIINCATTTLVVLIATFIVDRPKSPESQGPYLQEIVRALYFSIVGMIGICAMSAMEGDRTAAALIMISSTVPLLLLGNYHRKLRTSEAGVKADVWFPYTIFHFGIQKFLFFPIGFYLIMKMLSP